MTSDELHARALGVRLDEPITYSRPAEPAAMVRWDTFETAVTTSQFHMMRADLAERRLRSCGRALFVAAGLMVVGWTLFFLSR